MVSSPIGKIVRFVNPVNVDDSIGRTAESMRVSGVTVLPVLDRGRLVGLVTEGSILAAVASGNAKAVAAEPVASIASRDGIVLDPRVEIGKAAEIMANGDFQSLPVANENGLYVGILVRSDVVAAMREALRPQSIAGMATPLGVYLTTGHIRAGAGDFGLFLTGLAMIVMNFLALGVVYGSTWLFQLATHIPLWSVAFLPNAGGHPGLEFVGTVVMGASIPLFLLFLRLSVLSGYHGAEHMVVHAVESGEPLDTKHVGRLPRAHPRCGTNVVAAVGIFFLLTNIFSVDMAVLITVLILVIGWRFIGGLLQNYITTSRPSPRQLKSGIAAGERLLALYRENPSFQVSGFRRIWNTGMIQVMLGVTAGVLAFQYSGLMPPGIGY